MTKQKFTPAYPADLRERGVRIFREHRGDYASDNAVYKAIAPKLGCPEISHGPSEPVSRVGMLVI
ncbi:hypothetical protein AA12717_3647 [Gluconacetobacter sacchari DSM 12717]|uniref:Transposase n=1 Tax=Gluconacetobacter sacchari DSM 12717 TaxID=1307940 RepID=A0ABQ0PC54_9PROT|nr:hypothetical protein AA12717_3647 [Gluconacetobacter sacchari DSM 12717]